MTSTVAMPETTLTAAGNTAAATALPMDEDTFRAFYDRTARGLWSYLTRITGDRQLADDLVQEAYYRFYRAGTVYADETHRRNSLFQIATNLGRDALRRGRRRGTDVPLPEEHDTAVLVAGTDVASHVAGRTDLVRAMARLSPTQREMVWLAYAHGSSHQDIAEILGIKVGSVKSLLFRARRKLATFLGGERSTP
jgi:RNA polymerase sigma-70 factor (ECF subfamily)